MDGNMRAMRIIPILALCALSCTASPPGGTGDFGNHDLYGIDFSQNPNNGDDLAGPPPTCRPETCIAGCCKNGACMAGDSDTACGHGGGDCTACGSTTACDQQRCRDICGPLTCAGCCRDDGTKFKVCEGGGAVDKCGKNGAACINCGTGALCNAGTCVDASCSQNNPTGCCSGPTPLGGRSTSACGTGGAACVDCGAHYSCPNGTCVVDPNSTWDVKVLTGVVPDDTFTPPYNLGDTWDSWTGAPDPYVVFTTTDGSSPSVTGGDSGNEQSNNYKPDWQELVILYNVTAAQLKNSLVIEMWDHDSFSANDKIGICTLPLTDADFDGTVRTKVCEPVMKMGTENCNSNPCQAGWSLKIKVIPH
jgi:hypothetical protein